MDKWPYTGKEFILTVFFGKHVWETRCERDHATTVYYTFRNKRDEIIEIKGVDTAGTLEKISISCSEITAVAITPAIPEEEKPKE